MKLSIFTTVTNPIKRGDNHRAALHCYADLADELVVVNGGQERTATNNKSTTVVESAWPQEFSWKFIGQQFQKGYEASTGDWVIHADLDFIFHEEDFKAIRQACIDNENAPALSFLKQQFVLPDRYNIKSRLIIAVNKKAYGDRIRFDSGGDMCQPSVDGVYISPDDVPETGIPFYNYEKLCKTKEQIMDDTGRMERAWKRHFGETQYGSDGDDELAYKGWVKAQKGKMNKPQKIIPLSRHPVYIQKTISALTSEQWGYDGHGNLERNVYA